MLKIIHRVNTPQALETTPNEYGVEMDLHAYGDRLTVHHDAFVEGVSFESWLDHYNHAFVVLNVKEEGIETRVRNMVLARKIEAFFMLDLSFPALLKMVWSGEKRVALRVSEYEAPASAIVLAGKADWIWLDTFHGFPLTREDHNALRAAGFRFCLVSPELQGRDISEIAEIQALLARRGCTVDAVCTKCPNLW